MASGSVQLRLTISAAALEEQPVPAYRNGATERKLDPVVVLGPSWAIAA
ncbi:hypothetical protein [Sinorhizobium medicae]|nr:hypothetical protein [Sinorhizobium medicae]UWU06587.1 hypothetical protein N2598_09330 [Sinorhizobium medicae]